MQTKRAFRPVRAVIGGLMVLAGAGLIYWELFIHMGRIRIFGLAAALLIGVLGGLLVLVRSLAKVCAKCGTEIEATQLAYPPEVLPQAKAYATQRGSVDALLAARIVEAEDRERAILAADGCNTCRAFTRVSAHRAVWNNGGYFEAKEQTAWRDTDEADAPVLRQLLEGRIRT